MSQQRNHRSDSIGSRVIRILLIFLVILVAVAAGAYAYLQMKLDAINRIPPPDQPVVYDPVASTPPMEVEGIEWSEANLVTGVEGVVNVLLVGQDSRDEERQRSDSMILLSVNKNSNELTMISFMRDLYVEIPGYGARKINAAYQFGGFDLLDQTLAENFGIVIDYNVEVDFSGFKDIVDALGGVEITLNADEVEYLAGGGNNYEDGVVGRYTHGRTYELEEGVNLLNGKAALDYARARHVGNADYERTQRQRNVIKSIFKKLKKSSWLKLLKVYDSVASNVTTDMTNNQILSVAFSAYTMGVDEINSYRIPANDMFYEANYAGSVLVVKDWEETRQLIKDYLYSDDGGKAAFAALEEAHGTQVNMD